MAAKGWSVGRTAEVIGFARTAVRARDERVIIHVLVDPSCPRELVLAVKDALVPARSGGRVRVLPLRGCLPSAESPDAALALMGPGSDVAPALAHARQGVPVALVVEGALDVALPETEDELAARVGVVAASSPEVLADKLALWLAASVEKEIALAANFPFCRRAVTQRLISRCALQNAAVGAVHLIPGSDLPVMTANQVKLALDIAAAYGRPLEPARAAELAGVVCSGLAWRTIARTLLGVVPGIGLLVRTGVAYGGTLATGSALRARFDIESPRKADASSGDRPQAGEALPLASPQADDGYVTIEGGRA